MSPEEFLREFGHLAETEGGVQQVRQAIHQLAIMGKLGTQSPADPTALEGLARLGGKKPKQQWTRFPLPPGWHGCFLSDLCSQVHYGVTAKAKETPEGPRMLRITDIQNDRVNWETVPGCDIDGKAKAKASLSDGDLLIARTGGTIGKTYLVADLDREAVFASYLIRAVPLSRELSAYLKLFAGSALYWEQLRSGTAGTGLPNVSGTKLKALEVPVPPLPEQKRIVEKVDQLMALCDELEAKQKEKRVKAVSFNKAALSAVVHAPDKSKIKSSWSRVQDHFEVLYELPENVKELRQTILQLAVMGKLVRQEAGDVGTLLEEVRDMRERLVTEKKASPLRTKVSSERQFAVPNSWVWTTFGEATVCRDGQRIPVSRAERENRRGEFDYYGASGPIDKIDDYLFDKSLLLIGEDGANLINRSTPIAFIARGKYWVNNHAHVLDGPSEDYLRFLELFINAIDLKPYVTGTAQPKMNQAKMNSIPVALPPAIEQNLIVARVDGLMSHCDDLEAKLARHRDQGQRLMEAVVENLVA